MNKDALIDFILTHSTYATREELENMSIESLIMIKVQIEIELTQKFYN